MNKTLPPAFGLLGLLCSPLPAAEKITFDDHVFPIFESSCLNCHNPDKKKGDLDLSNYTGTMAGGSGGTIAEPGDGAGSKLYACITHTAEPIMPPKGDKLAKKDADLIRAWIDGGLLENASSQARKPSGPRIATLDVDPSARPEGPPPMPVNLNLEPAVVSERGTVINDMACSPWAPLLAVTGQKQILLYNTDTLRLAAILPFPKGFPESVSFHPTGKYLIAGGGIGGKSGATYTWDVTTGELLMENGREFDSVLTCSLRLDLGGVALGGPSRLIRLWDTQTGEQFKSIKKHTDWVTALSYSPDGVLLATGDRNGGVWVWEAHSGNEFHTLRGHNGGITAVGWRADSNILATASEDGQVIFWEMNNGGEVKKFGAHGGGTLSLDYARTGEFATSGRDRKVKVWKADFNLKKELPTFNEMVVEVALTSDGKRLFTADWNGKIEAWDGESFEKLGELSSTPPSIATRITALEEQLQSAPQATAAAKATLDTAQQALATAKGNLQTTVTGRDQAKALVAQLQQERQKLGEEMQRLNAEREKVVAMQATRQNELNQAEARVTAHREAIAKSEVEINGLDVTAAAATEAQLAADAEAKQKQSQENPEDQGLKQQAEEAAQRLAAHRARLEEMRGQLATAEQRLKDLNARLPEIASMVGPARTALDEAAGQLRTLDEQRAKASERNNAIGPEMQAANTRLAELEKAIKPAQDTVAAREKALAEPQAAYDKALAHEGSLRSDLQFWRAAQVNSKALEVTREYEDLKGQQDADQQAFDSVSKQVETFRAELAQVTTRKDELSTQLEKLAAEVSELKSAIEERAPGLKELEQRSTALKARFEELSSK